MSGKLLRSHGRHLPALSPFPFLSLYKNLHFIIWTQICKTGTRRLCFSLSCLCFSSFLQWGCSRWQIWFIIKNFLLIHTATLNPNRLSWNRWFNFWFSCSPRTALRMPCHTLGSFLFQYTSYKLFCKCQVARCAFAITEHKWAREKNALISTSKVRAFFIRSETQH